jgi:hypothetical protein
MSKEHFDALRSSLGVKASPMPSKEKPEQSLADYVTIALSPVLIMALVGSLVFFLLEILYVGQYSERLQWELFFFVFGMVLISRVAIEQGSEKAGVYGIALGIVVFLALQAFIEYPPGTPTASFGWLINLVLMIIIWWCTNKLVWDCTYIDDKVDASGKGVLEAAGLDDAGGDAEGSLPEEEPAGSKHLPATVAWWDRYRRYREAQRKKPHTPGVWVVYFSLAALPIYGLGQSLIPVDQPERRQRAFWFMVSYVGSGLGLLVTTSFLGLRRYLRQRKLKMPVGITTAWLLLGGSLIFIFLLIGALLPRPYGEYQLLNFTPLGTRERDASEYAMLRDGAGKGEGAALSDQAKKDQQAQGGSGGESDEKGGTGDKSDKSGGQGSGKKQGSGNQQGKQQSGKGDGKGDRSDESRSQERSGDKQDQQDQNQQQGSKRDPERKDSEQKDREKAQQKSGGSRPSSQGQKPSSTGKQKSGSGAKSPPSAIPQFLSRFGGLATFLKWLVFTILALVALFYLLRNGLKFLANFTDWAKRLLAWWAGLFGRKPQTDPEADAGKREKVARPRPFATFRNPFQDGTAERLAPEEVVRYSFEALESWAWERGYGRQPQETPLEFAERVAIEVPALEAEARGVAGLYARAAYARGRLPSGCLTTVEQFWSHLLRLEEAPLST